MLIHMFMYILHRFSISDYVVWETKIIFVGGAYRPKEKQINLKLSPAIKLKH